MAESYPFTIELKISHYNWTVKIYEPTLDEYEAMLQALKDGERKTLEQTMSGLLQSWDCTDRKGQPLPCNLEGIKQLPGSVFSKMITSLVESLNKGFSDPKANSESSPTTEPEAEGIATTPPL